MFKISIRFVLQSYEKTREVQKERTLFFCTSECQKLRQSQSYEKTSAKQKKPISFFCRVPSKFALEAQSYDLEAPKTIFMPPNRPH